ncbi:BREX-1 system adenine-specific DNA-methyltransferase PglX [Mycobacterium yunnanensis]|uniref:site-specific DNA-methyltransferase (adenine-specific) n=1 Tax=Mycobacterium yunnanensis TaxID=368477 RepID=A0A9X2Z022_9MYCO|nr:BREX-1 system adenine-specific DNA-methyltransferase PglX [Mycobacterium yunnanensis]MCV7421383.1 BREX-1 system adenine-specific DNA-methyltransferase PglX [Mycobacterium yunnanensis]
MTSLTVDQRARLEDVVLAARGLLEADLVSVAAGRYGIDADGRVVDERQLQLDPNELADRRELLTVLEYLRLQETGDDLAVTAMIREAVFTHLNRLLSIRIAEQSGLFPQSLAAGRGSHGFTDLLELAPALVDDDTRGYATYLALCGDELAGDVPQLFDPRNPLLKLMPSPSALDELVDVLADPTLADLWAADDTLGWAYQFFNRKEERDAMREASATPRTSRELAVRNQFFTPGYVVDYLIQNTLGRHLAAHDPTGQLASQLSLLVDPPGYCGTPWDLEDIRVLDPAVGSGHFLLGAYDLLETAWELAGVKPADAAPHIVNSLWGIDIDLRPAQVAATAVTLRARGSAKHLALPSPHIITARGLPDLDPTILDHLGLSTYHVDVLTDVAEALKEAPLLGSALKAELALQDRLGRAGLPGVAANAAQPTLTAEHGAFADDEAILRDALSHLADATTSTAAERLFAAGGEDALRFVEALTQRYDVVLMNPPFGDPITETRDYLRAAYPWAPTRLDLLAIFVGRGLELCKPGGYLGAITGRAGLFTSTFRPWREQIILGHQLITLADLGYRVMSQAKVEAAAYVIRNQTPEPEATATFIRMLRDADKANGLSEAIYNAQTNAPDRRIYRIPQSTFATLPGSPIAYSASHAILRLFAELPSIGEHADAVVGLQTSDDGRFVRAFWEVDPRQIARTREETATRRWAPFAKGGTYAPYWSDIHLVVDYENNGQRLKAFDKAYIRNERFYFRTGVTWPRRTNSAFSVRALPMGCIFADKGPCLFSADSSMHYLGFLNSRFARLMIETTATGADENQSDMSRSYEVGTIRSFPDAVCSDTALSTLVGGYTSDALAPLAVSGEFDESARRFVKPAVLGIEAATIRQRAAAAYRNQLEVALAVIEAHDEIDRALSAALDPDGEAEAALYDADGPLVTDLPHSTSVNSSLLSKPVREIVDLAAEKLGIARWIGLQHQVVDRRLELAATLEGVHPRSLVDRLPAGALPDGEPAGSAHDLLSYLVGAAFGRWDIRIGINPALAPPRPDPLDPVPLCPPGMLVGTDGFPATSAPENYPLELPPDGLLLDEPGHPHDIVNAITRAATTLFPDTDAVLDELTTILDATDLRALLRRGFFRHHRTRYSKSKRTAPLYWPLTVPSRRWGLWLYAPTLRRDTLFAIAGAAASRMARAESELLRLQGERDAGGAGRSTQQVMTALTAEQELAEELSTFRREAERLANSGWIPDLNDGFPLTAAPLNTLIPDWPELAKTLTDTKAGKNPWATTHTWRNQL